MPPVCTTGDMHACPMMTPATPPIPHVGGPVTVPGQIIVRVMNMPVAVVSGQTLCTGMPGPDPMVRGSTMVRITGMPVMRIGDGTSHGGVMISGKPTVRVAM